MALVRRVPPVSAAVPSQRAQLASVENLDALLAAHAHGKGVLLLAGHFGNFEVATAAGIAKFPQARGAFYFVRRPFKPRWLENFVYGRSRRLGFGTLPKQGSLDLFVERLEAGDIILFPFDQYALGRDGIEVEFFGHRAGTFRSLAILALATGAPVVPAACWREPDGHHVLRFEEALAPIACEDHDEEIRRNTRALQCHAGAIDPAPPGAMVVDASALEDRNQSAALAARLNVRARREFRVRLLQDSSFGSNCHASSVSLDGTR